MELAHHIVCHICRKIQNTVKPVLWGHSKIEKTNILMTNGSLMKVKSIAECSCNTFDLHKAMIGLEIQFLVFVLSGRLKKVLLFSDICWISSIRHC